MSHTKITFLIVGILSFSYSFSQTVEQDFSVLDKNKDGKIDKSEFQSPPPAPPAPAASPKQKSNASTARSAEKSEAVANDEEKEVKKEEMLAEPTFESIDTNGDGIIDMNEFKLNHTIVRKRPGATRNAQ